MESKPKQMRRIVREEEEKVLEFHANNRDFDYDVVDAQALTRKSIIPEWGVGTEEKQKEFFGERLMLQDLEDAAEASGRILETLTNARSRRLSLYKETIQETSGRMAGFKSDLSSLPLEKKAGFAGILARAEEFRAEERARCRADIERIDKEIASAEEKYKMDKRMLDMSKSMMGGTISS